jgi:hypothetical protein
MKDAEAFSRMTRSAKMAPPGVRVPDPPTTCEGKPVSRFVGRRCHCRSTGLTSSLAALGHPKVAMLLDELLAGPCNFGGATSLLHTN